MTVVLLLLVARHGGTTELLVKGRNYGAGQVHDCSTAAASCELRDMAALALRSCWYGGRNYGAGQEHEGGTAAASCETWRHDGAAGTEGGTTELESWIATRGWYCCCELRDMAALRSCWYRGRNYGAG
jgi:hypothetical protein